MLDALAETLAGLEPSRHRPGIDEPVRVLIHPVKGHVVHIR